MSAAAWATGPICAYPVSSPWDPFVGPPAPILMCDPTGYAESTREDAPSEGDARAALATARRLHAAGRHDAAVLHLRAAAEAEPILADRFALEEADYRMAAGPDEHACEAYARAMESPQRAVATRGRIGHVRCLLAIGDRDGQDELTDLRRRYPQLPYSGELDLALGQAREAWGEARDAGALYRRIDLMSPGSAPARIARERLARLAEEGVAIRPLTANQRVDRAGRLVRAGPMDMAREEVEALRQMEDLPSSLRQQVARHAARIARVEGRWEDASQLLREARGLPGLEPAERVAMNERIVDLERAAESREAEAVLRRIRRMTRGRRLGGLPSARLFAILRIAARAEQAEVVSDVLAAILDRDRMPPGLCFDAAIFGAGTGDDEHVAALFQRAARHPNFATRARYHRARALERLGRMDEARTEYARVIADDSPRLPYYAMWSRQRLRTMRPVIDARPLAPLGPTVCEDGPYSPTLEEIAAKTGQAIPRSPTPILCLPPPHNPFSTASRATGEPVDPIAEADEAATDSEIANAGVEPPDFTLTEGEIIELLTPIAEAYGDEFPWLRRAEILVRVGELDAAGDEIHETYTAWRDARGRGSLRAGLEGVLRGGAPPRHRTAAATWRARRSFPVEARRELARVSAALGDHGLAIRFASSFDIAGPRPRAYEPLVEEAAARHHVEPELLFAVMRVESVYNPRIISYAGAIGLMQIMPRTGRFIAERQGRQDFTIDQLLIPEINIDMAAWYLASLMERFDGRLPLAIASYNGGPHNVRRWMRSHSPVMPLDAFLERIPFNQTHRYVRRVMTHYEAYLAQRGGVVQPIDTRLPRLAVDRVAF